MQPTLDGSLSLYAKSTVAITGTSALVANQHRMHERSRGTNRIRITWIHASILPLMSMCRLLFASSAVFKPLGGRTDLNV